MMTIQNICSVRGKCFFYIYISPNIISSGKYGDDLYTQIFGQIEWMLPTWCLPPQCLSGFIVSQYCRSVFQTPTIDHINSSFLSSHSLKYFHKIFQNIFASTKDLPEIESTEPAFFKGKLKTFLKNLLNVSRYLESFQNLSGILLRSISPVSYYNCAFKLFLAHLTGLHIDHNRFP